MGGKKKARSQQRKLRVIHNNTVNTNANGDGDANASSATATKSAENAAPISKSLAPQELLQQRCMSATVHKPSVLQAAQAMALAAKKPHTQVNITATASPAEAAAALVLRNAQLYGSKGNGTGTGTAPALATHTNKNSNASRQKKQGSSSVTITFQLPPPPPRQQRIQLDPLDNVDRVLQHLHTTHELDSQLLAKAMPRLAQGLRQGTIRPSDVSHEVGYCYEQAFASDLPQPSKNFFVRLAETSLSFQPDFKDRLSHEEFDLFWQHLNLTMINGLDTVSHEEMEAQEYAANDELNEQVQRGHLQEAFEETCRQWEYVMDTKVCRGGAAGSFLKRCPLYGLTPRQFILAIKSIVNDECALTKHLYKIRSQLDVAASRIAKNVLEAKRTCWTCGGGGGGGTTDSELLACSGCKVAHYCGRKCQRNAWKQGHNNKCASLPHKYKLFQESVQAIETMHSKKNAAAANNTKDSGLVLRKLSDYYLLGEMFKYPTLVELETGLQGLKGPSMEYFYKNFAHIQKGDWWLLEPADTMDVYMSEWNRRGSRVGDSEPRVFHYMVYLLAYDYIEFFYQKCPPSLCSPAYIHKFVSKMLNNWMEQLDWFKDLDTRMPAKRFIQLYSQMLPSDLAEDGPEWNRRRRDLKKVAFTGLRKSHHTSSPYLKEGA